MSGRIQHNAPGGKKYSSIRDAGEQTLATYCQRFPQSPDRESFILPTLFESEHPENVVQDDASLPEADKKLLKGLNTNIRGERGEYEIYKVFYTLVRQSPTESILVIHGYGLDNDNGRNLKKHAIIRELPNIDLSNVRMKMEHDFIVIISNIGIVLCEVKTSANAKNIESAESQLHNSDTFVKQIMTAIAGPTAPQLPTVKVIMVPNEASSLIAPTKHNDCHVIYQDDLQNFTPKWTQIVNELKTTAQSCLVSPISFEHLVQFLVGVWTMKCMTKNTYDFDKASLSTDIATIDLSVNRAEFAPTKQGQKLTTDIATSMNEVFQRVDDLNIMYLSPQQKSLYDNYRHALIHSHAGAGKTMLIVFKIIELLEADPTQKVVLVAPHPHHLRLQEILNKHNIATDIIIAFPYTESPKSTSPSIGSRIKKFFKLQTKTEDSLPSETSQPTNPLSTCDVLIITLQDFFEVPKQTLMQYDISKFNIFVDDMHSYEVPFVGENKCNFTDIGDFVDNSYNLLNSTGQYAWFAFDVAQHEILDRIYYRRSDRLFFTSDERPRTFSIPVVTMNNVLRYTKEITDVIVTARQEQVNNSRYFYKQSDHLISDIGCGHNITTGTRVLYEKLQEDADEEHQSSTLILFVCHRVRALLRNLTTTTSPQPNGFPYSTVAVLFYNDHDLRRYKPPLQSMIKQEFKVGVQTIERQLLTNNKSDVIIDHRENIQSFESPTMVYVRPLGSVNRAVYNMLSRARTKCVVVDVDTAKPPLPLQHIDVIMWKKENEIFKKV